MATSQNGWRVYTRGDHNDLVPTPYLTGRVLKGNVETVLNYVAEQFHKRVEPIVKSHSWGWAYRPVRGQTSGYSNHASGTAQDINAPKHPIGKRNTFTNKQVIAIRAILEEVGGVVRWGGDFKGRPDEMHYEINANESAVANVAARLRSNVGGAYKEDTDMKITDVLKTLDDGTKVTVGMALERGLYAYDRMFDGGYLPDRVKKLEGNVVDYDGNAISVTTAAQRGAHAYGAIFANGWAGKRDEEMRDRLSDLEEKMD